MESGRRPIAIRIHLMLCGPAKEFPARLSRAAPGHDAVRSVLHPTTPTDNKRGRQRPPAKNRGPSFAQICLSSFARREESLLPAESRRRRRGDGPPLQDRRRPRPRHVVRWHLIPPTLRPIRCIDRCPPHRPTFQKLPELVGDATPLAFSPAESLPRFLSCEVV